LSEKERVGENEREPKDVKRKVAKIREKKSKDASLRSFTERIMGVRGGLISCCV